MRTMFTATRLALVLSALTFTLADVEFVKPAGGSSATPGAITWSWKDSGAAPALKDLLTYSIDLMAGGDTDATSMIVINLVPGGTAFSSISSGQGVVNPSQGGSTKNAYYLRITSAAKAGGQTIVYSPRFSVSGMTGTFSSAAVKQYLAGNPITDTSARAPINQVADTPAAGGAAGAPDAAQFDVAYNMQTGPTRYAPMMQQPPTAITKKDTAPLFPTSSVKIAKTFLPPAVEAGGVVTTLTQSNTHFVSQMENTVAPVSNPNADMQKFLNRWKD